MKFELKDLISVIGKKFGIEVSDDLMSNLKEMPVDDNLLEFFSELQKVVEPLMAKGGEIELQSGDQIKDIIPSEYWSEVPLIDEDGKNILSLSELEKAIHSNTVLDFSKNENVAFEREKLKASFVHDEYPVYAGLEHSWRELQSEYYDVIEREDQPANDPLSSFSYYVMGGFYPPPELMIMMARAIEKYFDSAGDKSFDEVFFGDKHQKTKSFAYKKHRKRKYMFFEWSISMRGDKGKTEQSLEDQVSEFIEENNPITLALNGINPSVDVDTFLRGYRRWKQEMKQGKYD